MNVHTLEAPVVSAPAKPARSSAARQLRSAAPTTAPARPGRRTGRSTGPAARPGRRLDGPSVVRGRTAQSQACAVAAPQPAARPRQWRLTDRGIALVLLAGMVIATAALAVVGLTALRVTGERYQPDGQSLVQRLS